MAVNKENVEIGIEAMNDLTDFFNSGNYEAQNAFAEKFSSEHRTLQQNVLRNFFGIMVHCAKQYENGHYDARNESGLKACKVMVDAFKEKHQYAPNMGMAHI